MAYKVFKYIVSTIYGGCICKSVYTEFTLAWVCVNQLKNGGGHFLSEGLEWFGRNDIVVPQKGMFHQEAMVRWESGN